MFGLLIPEAPVHRSQQGMTENQLTWQPGSRERVATLGIFPVFCLLLPGYSLQVMPCLFRQVFPF